MESAEAMRSLALFLAWTLALAAAPAAGPAVWVRVVHGETELLGAVDAAQAKVALAELEALRGALAAAAPELAGARARLRIVVFHPAFDDQPFRVNAYSPAYYAPGPGWSAIVVHRLEKDTLPALRHEFIHHLVRASGHKLPLWLDEGLADALSPLPGEEAKRRTKLLRRGQRLPWRELLEARRGSVLCQDWEQARLFYAQSWALTEALIAERGGALSAADLERWQRLDGSSGQQAEDLLRRFVKRPRPAGRRWSRTAPSVGVEVTAAPAALVWTVLGRLSLQLGNTGAAETWLRQAALTAAEALPLLGDLEYRRGRLEEARMWWREAMARGAADGRTLLRLAVLEQDLPGGDMVPVLEQLLAIDPAQEEARLALAAQYIRRQRWAEAWQRLCEVRTPPARWADFYNQAVSLARVHVLPAEAMATN